jgi:hypothetical protein
VITVVQSPLMSNVIRGLTSEIAGSSELSRTYRERIVDPRLEQLRLVVARGVERGDLRPDTDLRLAHELLLGPVFYRLLYSGQPLDDGLGRARGLRRPARLRSRVIAATARRARAGPALNRARDPVGPALDAAIRCRTMRRILGRPGGGGDSGPDFSRVDSREKAEQLVSRGELARLHLVPTEFGGSDDVRNLVYVPPFVVGLKQQTDANVVVPLIEEGRVRSYAATPRYEGASFVPSSIEIRASDPEDFAASLRIWGAALDDA